MRRRMYLPYFAAGVVAVLTVGACSNGGSGADSAADAAASGGLAYRPHRSAAQAELAPAAGSATSTDRTSGGSGSGQVVNAVRLDDGTYKIRTAEMTVAVKGARHVADQADAAGRIALQAGGEVDSDNRTSGPQASAMMQLRVPPDTLGATLAALGRLGTERSRRLSTTDVTQKVADVDSRVTSARHSIARLRVLFAHATKIGDIIALESELNSREADLESLEAQQRSLDRQTSMATITLSLVTAVKHAAPPAKPEKKRGGFLGGLERGWTGFSAAAVWVAAAVGTLLPFLVLLFLVALGARLLWPRLPRRHGPAPAPTE